MFAPRHKYKYNQKYKYKYKYTARYHTCRPAHWEVWGLRLKSRELCTFITACQRLMYRKAIISIIIIIRIVIITLMTFIILSRTTMVLASYLRLMWCTPINVILIRVSLYAWSGDEIQNTRFWTSRNSRKEKHYHCEKGRLLNQILERMWPKQSYVIVLAPINSNRNTRKPLPIVWLFDITCWFLHR